MDMCQSSGKLAQETKTKTKLDATQACIVCGSYLFSDFYIMLRHFVKIGN
jgi:hypothetical protein